jgi:GxxExxY protein
MHPNDPNKYKFGRKLLHGELSYRITGILFKVHQRLGRFCTERQYANVFEQAMKNAEIQYQRETLLPVDTEWGKIYGNKADFIIDNKILIEIKTKPFITKTDYFQTRRYLAAARLELGLLVNFRNKFLKPKRILYRH